MNLIDILTKNRSSILDEWIKSIANSYPPETAKFLLSKKDRFANPVGHAIVTECQNLYDQLLAGNATDGDVPEFIDRIVRIRALQDFTPSAAISFVFDLKAVIRSKYQDKIEEHQLDKEMFLFEVSVDKLALLAFDIYESCRETVHKAKALEMKNHFANVLKRSDMFFEAPEQMQQEPDVPKPKPIA